jgi:hypothetical protein
MDNLSMKLTADSTSTEGTGMAISEESAGVGYDLANVEAGSIVNTSSVVGADEKWASHAAVGDAAVVGTLGVGECKTRWTRLALRGLVNVCSCDSRREIVACNAGESDVL